jgi:epoxyqueuosine reductase QueG
VKNDPSKDVVPEEKAVPDPVELTRRVTEFACSCGADLVGVADLERLRGIQTIPPDLLDGYSRAVSIAVRVADGVIDPIVDRPTPIYQQHYFKVNALLDDMGIRVGQLLQRYGGRALPIPASQTLDSAQWLSYISHKAVAVAAGIGWQGKSLLLTNRHYGPRVRLATILTDLDLEPDRPVKNLCARCTACVDACPAQAIRNVNTTLHYSNREEAIDLDKCVARVLENRDTVAFIETPLCGVCIRACPFGQRKKSR